MPTSSQSKPEWYAEGLAFSCTQCGNCCSGPPGYVWMDDDEVRAIAGHLQLAVPEFLRRHARKVDGRWTLNERLTPNGYDCVFLQRDDQGKALCTIYSVRPIQCRTWPFWNDNLRKPRDWERARTRCPGIDKGKLYPLPQIRILRDQTPEF